MVKDPEVGFMQATYWQLWTSFSVSFCRSYLQRGDQRWHPDPPPPPQPLAQQCLKCGKNKKPTQ